MGVREVLIHPNALLKRVASTSERVDASVLSLVQDLNDTMASHERCVGLSAPQIGVLERVVILNVEGHPKATENHGFLTLIDPIINTHSGSELGREGCLSIPSFTVDVIRWQQIELRALGIDGEEKTFSTSGFEARVIQHEIDHLDGVLILDRAASPAEIFRRRSTRSKS